MEPVLTLKKIEKRYRGERVLGPVSLQLFPSEIAGIRGANGAGKSTLLSIAAGILAPTEGTRSLTDPHAIVGLVPQDIALYSTMSGKANLSFWADVYKLPPSAARSRIGWLLAQMNLTDKSGAKVSEYSGGMKRRLNLAAALLLTPDILLLDEPTVGADAASVRIILEMMKKMQSLGCAIAFISHHQDELSAICNRVITLDHGVIVSSIAGPISS